MSLPVLTPTEPLANQEKAPAVSLEFSVDDRDPFEALGVSRGIDECSLRRVSALLLHAALEGGDWLQAMGIRTRLWRALQVLRWEADQSHGVRGRRQPVFALTPKALVRAIKPEKAIPFPRLWAMDPEDAIQALGELAWHRSQWEAIARSQAPAVTATLLELRTAALIRAGDRESLAYELASEGLLDAAASDAYLRRILTGCATWLFWGDGLHGDAPAPWRQLEQGPETAPLRLVSRLSEGGLPQEWPEPLRRLAEVGYALRPDLGGPLVAELASDVAQRPDAYRPSRIVRLGSRQAVRHLTVQLVRHGAPFLALARDDSSIAPFLEELRRSVLPHFLRRVLLKMGSLLLAVGGLGWGGCHVLTTGWSGSLGLEAAALLGGAVVAYAAAAFLGRAVRDEFFSVAVAHRVLPSDAFEMALNQRKDVPPWLLPMLGEVLETREGVLLDALAWTVHRYVAGPRVGGGDTPGA